MTKIPTATDAISIVLPAHNEEGFLRSTVQALQDWSNCHDRPIQIVIVEDGCTDATPQISAALAEECDNVMHIHTDERIGKGNAVETGFAAADTDIVCFMDVDLSTQIDYLDDLIQPIEDGDADLTIGSRYLSASDADRDAKRDMLSRVYNRTVTALFRTGVSDHQCGFKAMDRSVFNALQDSIDADGWFWDTELLAEARQQGFTVEEVPVRWIEEEDSDVDIVPVSIELLRGILRLKGEQVLGHWYPIVWQYTVFSLIGALGAILNTAILYVVTEFFGVHYMLSAVVAIETAIIAMFFLNNHITFNTAKVGVRQVVDGLIRSNIVRSVGTVIHLALLYALAEFADIHYLVANIIAITIASLANFAGEKTFNWDETLLPDTDTGAGTVDAGNQ